MSDPRKPHIVNFYASGKAKCENCAGFTSPSICAHVLAACLTKNKTQSLLRWLVQTKHNTSGINVSAAVAFGMPRGRGKKGKRGTASRTPVPCVVPRTPISSNGHPRHNLPESSFSSPGISTADHHYGFPPTAPVPGLYIRPPTYQTSSLQSGAMISCFPSPNQGQFIVYLLQYCPPQTSVCFGCSNGLKHNGTVLPPPRDLVIVSKMARDWVCQGVVYSKPANVYFHCNTACIKRKQPFLMGKCVLFHWKSRTS